MSNEAIIELLRQTPLSFVGTIEQFGVATMDVVIDDRTALVYVDRVLHAPDNFLALGGQRVTLQLARDLDPPKLGTTAAFFVHVLAIGHTVAVAEVGRLPLNEVEPYLRLAAHGGERPFAELERELNTINFVKHAAEADAVLLGRVVKLENVSSVGETGISEHDPDWWVATLYAYHVERGDIEAGEVRVRYANSLDMRWRDAPKPKASQGGLWLLHRTDANLADVAPFEVLHAEDWQPVQSLNEIRKPEDTNGLRPSR